NQATFSVYLSPKVAKALIDPKKAAEAKALGVQNIVGIELSPHTLFKIEAPNKETFLPYIRQTLEEPDLLIKNQGLLFLKEFKDPKTGKNFISVAQSDRIGWHFSQYSPQELEAFLKEQIQQGQIAYNGLQNKTPHIEPNPAFGEHFKEFEGKGAQAVAKLLQEQRGQVAGAFYREDLGESGGYIDLVWGASATDLKGLKDSNGKPLKPYGLSKILEKHLDDFKGFEGANALEKLGNGIEAIIRNGEVLKTHNGYNILYRGYKVGLNEGWNEGGVKKGSNRWVVTAYDNSKSLEEKNQGRNSDSFTKGETLPLNPKDNSSTSALKKKGKKPPTRKEPKEEIKEEPEEPKYKPLEEVDNLEELITRWKDYVYSPNALNKLVELGHPFSQEYKDFLKKRREHGSREETIKVVELTSDFVKVQPESYDMHGRLGIGHTYTFPNPYVAKGVDVADLPEPRHHTDPQHANFYDNWKKVYGLKPTDARVELDTPPQAHDTLKELLPRGFNQKFMEVVWNKSPLAFRNFKNLLATPDVVIKERSDHMLALHFFRKDADGYKRTTIYKVKDGDAALNNSNLATDPTKIDGEVLFSKVKGVKVNKPSLKTQTTPNNPMERD
ncbi:putative barnase/colicin E5 family endoribonuclease, partial [Helicobacter bizzozeronii]